MDSCNYCTNSVTCEELTPENDLSYIGVGEMYTQDIRIFFRTGDNRKTGFVIEQITDSGWKSVGFVALNNCPFCGRPLVENNTKEIKIYD